MSLEVDVCSVTDLLVGTRYTPQQNLRGNRSIMHGITGRSLEDRATAGFPLTKNYLRLGIPSLVAGKSALMLLAALGSLVQHKIPKMTL